MLKMVRKLQNAGVQPGDLIIDVNSEPVKEVADFKKAIDNADKSGRKFILVKISRGTEETFITMPFERGKEISSAMKFNI